MRKTTRGSDVRFSHFPGGSFHADLSAGTFPRVLQRPKDTLVVADEKETEKRARDEGNGGEEEVERVGGGSGERRALQH